MTSELIAKIRAWQEADAENERAKAEHAKGATDDTYDACHNAWILWRNAARKMLPSEFDAVAAREALAAFVALADENDALKAKIAALESGELSKWCRKCHGYGYDVFDINGKTCDVCKGEGVVFGNQEWEESEDDADE